MPRNKLIKFALLLILVVFAYILTVPAQEKRCNLKVELAESETKKSVDTAKIVLIDTQSKKEFQVETPKSLVFSNLKEGSYEIRVTKEGFKQSIYKTDFVCDSLEKENFKTISVWLWQGNSEEKVEYEKAGVATRIEGTGISSGLSERERLKEVAKRSNILNFDAIYLEKPKYPSEARAAKISGIVYVQITVNEKGKVESAEAIEGNPLLREAAVDAAKKAKFNPLLKEGQPTKFSGKLIYSFTSK